LIGCVEKFGPSGVKNQTSISKTTRDQREYYTYRSVGIMEKEDTESNKAPKPSIFRPSKGRTKQRSEDIP